MALSLVLLIISTAIMCSFSVFRVAEKSYKPSNSGTISSVMNNGQTEELSEFDAWVEYSIVLDALDGDSEQEYRFGNVYLSTENVMRLEQLADIEIQGKQWCVHIHCASGGMLCSHKEKETV